MTPKRLRRPDPHTQAETITHSGRLPIRPTLALSIALLTAGGCESAAAWQPMGGGVRNSVHAFTVLDGQLVAGGWSRNDRGGNTGHVARWDGAEWLPLGTVENGEVRALAVFDDHLIIGGNFGAKRWDGSEWQPLGDWVFSWGGVAALTVFDGDLIAGGTFRAADGQPANRVARWDGSAWHPLGEGMDGDVAALAVFDGDLIAGGSFSTAGGQEARRIARWDGSVWHPIGAGRGSTVQALTVFQGDLIVAGGGRPARWTGSEWQEMSGGMNRFNSIAAHGDELFAAGGITEEVEETGVRGQRSSYFVARWDGAAWQKMGSANGHIDALTVFDDGLIAGGYFTSLALPDGGTRNVARWGTP